MDFAYGYDDRPLDGYKIRRGVGKGAFGEVYYAISDGGREVALKRLGENAAIELRGVNRCINIKSPHLVSIFDIKNGEDKRPYIIMEYVAGPSLRDLLKTNPKGLKQQKAIQFFHGIAAALTALHNHSIVHRDLKPENIFLDGEVVKIGDYGLAKHISLSQAAHQTINLGTVHYMAPEIANGKYDHRVDIYALGIVLYEMLTGETPFQGRDIYEIALKHSSAQVDLDKVPKAFRAILAKATAKNPKTRYATVAAMVKEVNRLYKGRQQTAPQGYTTINDNPAPGRTAAPYEDGLIPADADAPPRPAVSMFSDKNWFNRIFMAAIAAMAMAFAASLVPDIGFNEVTSHKSLMAAELLPLLLIIMLGSIFSSGISLWFYNHRQMSGPSVMACRFLTATIISLLSMLAFAFGPYFIFTQNYFDGDFGLGMNLSIHQFQEFLLIVFIGALLVNWFEVNNPERTLRLNISAALKAGLIGWLGCIISNADYFLPSGILAGIVLGANFLSPMAEDVGLPRMAPEPERPVSHRHQPSHGHHPRVGGRKKSRATPWPFIILFLIGFYLLMGILPATGIYLPFFRHFYFSWINVHSLLVLTGLVILFIALIKKRPGRQDPNGDDDPGNHP